MIRHTFITGVLILLHTITVAQNVGLGTGTPTSKLDVQGAVGSTTHLVNARVNYVGAADIKAFAGYSVPAAGAGSGGEFTGGLVGVEAYGTGTTTGGTVWGLYASATGTAGTRIGAFGTATGGANNYGVYGSSTGGAGSYAVYGNNLSAGGYAGYFNGRGHFADDLTVFSRVAIGTGTAPVTKLHIIGGADVSLTGLGFAQFGATSSWNLIMDDNEIMARDNGLASPLYLQQDAGNLLLCGVGNGNVGIGIQTQADLPPGYVLAVDGKIIGEELRIQNSTAWPDYVFDPAYELMPLAELKSTIARDRHLPRIPSASEVLESGILVGDMQKRMMEKIEELTLYIIQLYEANERLQQEVDELKKRN